MGAALLARGAGIYSHSRHHGNHWRLCRHHIATLNRLVAERDKRSELGNFTAGTVISSVHTTASALWLALETAESNYCDNLNYGLIALIEADEYNSNGFIQGIINVVVATTNPTDAISTFYLADKFVPAAEFQRSACNQ